MFKFTTCCYFSSNLNFSKMDEESHGQISKLLKEAVIMLCKNGISFEGQMRVQGLIGVTLNDGTVILVHMNECVNEDGYSAADKPVENPEDMSASSHQLCSVDVNKQYPAEECQWPAESQSDISTYSHVKQERGANNIAMNQQSGSQNTAYVPVAENPSLSLVHQSTLRDHDANSDLTYVESASRKFIKHEASGNWNPYSTFGQSDCSDYSAVQLPEAQGNYAAVQDVTSQYGESFGSMSGYEESGLTHYSTASMSQKPHTPNLSARRVSSKRDVVLICLFFT